MKAWYKAPWFWIVLFLAAASVFVLVAKPEFIFPVEVVEEEVVETLFVEETPRLDELEFRMIRLEVAACANENVIRQMLGKELNNLEECHNEWNGYMLDG